METRKPNRVAWRLAVLMAMAVFGGGGLLAAGLRPYWVARHRGAGADLRGSILIGASLAGTDLSRANFRGANLHGANLRAANLVGTDLGGADLTGVDLRDAIFEGSGYMMIETVGQGRITCRSFSLLVNLTSARFDCHTRWPDGFDPIRHGAVRVN